MEISSGLWDRADISGLVCGPEVFATGGLGPGTRLISSLLAECGGRTFSRGKLPCRSWVTRGLLASTLDTGRAELDCRLGFKSPRLSSSGCPETLQSSTGSIFTTTFVSLSALRGPVGSD